MRDLSDNKYIDRYKGSASAYNLNKLLFGEIAAPRAVNRESFTFAVHDLLDSLGFALHLMGYKYLAYITECYLLDDDYSFERAVEKTSCTYRTTEIRVKDNLFTCVKENHSFSHVASRLLNLTVDPFSGNSMDEVVEILGAIFKRYFNYYLR